MPVTPLSNISTTSQPAPSTSLNRPTTPQLTPIPATPPDIFKPERAAFVNLFAIAALFHVHSPKKESQMSTPAQAAASIANSKLSTGPSSDAGKQTVSSNALHHGLASPKPAHVALPGEEELLATHLESYRMTC